MNYKYVGILKEEIAKYWKIEEHKNKPILVYNNRKQHVIASHLHDFGSIEKIEKVYNCLDKIIKNPDYVFYNTNTKGLEYYKKLEANICVAVRINTGKVLKIKSWYPASSTKITNRKRKEMELKSKEDEKVS